MIVSETCCLGFEWPVQRGFWTVSSVVASLFGYGFARLLLRPVALGRFPMPVAHGDTAVRRDLLERIVDARRRSDALFDIVKAGALYERPIPERHRIIF